MDTGEFVRRRAERIRELLGVGVVTVRGWPPRSRTCESQLCGYSEAHQIEHRSGPGTLGLAFDSLPQCTVAIVERLPIPRPPCGSAAFAGIASLAAGNPGDGYDLIGGVSRAAAQKLVDRFIVFHHLRRVFIHQVFGVHCLVIFRSKRKGYE